MKTTVTTAMADLERLGHWASKTLHSDPHELRDLFTAWCEVSGLKVSPVLLREMAELIAAQYPAKPARPATAAA